MVVTDWTLAADLDDFGQNSVCIIWQCDGAVSRQNINYHRPLVVELKKTHPLPSLKSGLAGLVSLIVCTFKIR